MRFADITPIIRLLGFSSSTSLQRYESFLHNRKRPRRDDGDIFQSVYTRHFPRDTCRFPYIIIFTFWFFVENSSTNHCVLRPLIPENGVPPNGRKAPSSRARFWQPTEPPFDVFFRFHVYCECFNKTRHTLRGDTKMWSFRALRLFFFPIFDVEHLRRSDIKLLIYKRIIRLSTKRKTTLCRLSGR